MVPNKLSSIHFTLNGLEYNGVTTKETINRLHLERESRNGRTNTRLKTGSQSS